MKFLAIFVVSKDHELLIETIYQEEEQMPDYIIRKGLFETIKDILASKPVSQIEFTEVFNKHIYFLKHYGDITVVVISTAMLESSRLADQVAWRFFRKYHEIDFLDEPERETFIEFKNIMSTCIQHYIVHISRPQQLVPDQIKHLTAIEIFSLPHHLQATAKYIFENGTVKYKELSNELSLDKSDAMSILEELVEQGYISKTPASESGEYLYSMHTQENGVR